MTALPFGKTAVYRLYDADDRLLYVGVGSDPESRWKDHARSKDWWPAVARKAVVWRDSRSEALKEEYAAIRDESPLHNKAAWEPRAVDAPVLSTVTHVPVDVLRKNLGRIIAMGHFRSEHTVIEKNGVPMAVMVSFEWFQRHRDAGESESGES